MKKKEATGTYSYTNSNKLSSYRMVDSIFRLHARLYKLQHTIYRTTASTLTAAKLNSAGQGGVATAITAIFVTFLINYLELDQKSPYWWLFYLLLIPVVCFYWRAWREAASGQKKFDDLIRQAGGQDLDTWVDFHLDQIAAYGTRLKMIADAAKENEELYKSNRIEKAQYVRDKKLCEKIQKYCVEELDWLENANEELYPKRRSNKEYDEVKDRLQVARLGT